MVNDWVILTELEETYSRIGDFMKQKCGGYFGYVFTGNLDLAKKIGLKAKRRIEFYTSTIDCRLLEYELYSGSRETVRRLKSSLPKTHIPDSDLESLNFRNLNFNFKLKL